MSGVFIESKRNGDIYCSHVKIGKVEAIMRQVGNLKRIECKGRGNVRQAKALVREIHKAIQ